MPVKSIKNGIPDNELSTSDSAPGHALGQPLPS
jgi:hypothetical protein